MLAPVIVVAGILVLVFSHKPLTELDVQALKLLMWAFGPIVFAFWFTLVTRWLEVRRNGGDRDGAGWANVRGLLGWIGSFVGTTLTIMATGGENSWLALVVVAVGIMSPAIFYAMYRSRMEEPI